MFLILYLLSLFSVPPQIDDRNLVVFGARDGFVLISNDSLYYTIDGVDFDRRKHNFGLDMYRMQPVPKAEKNSKTFMVSSGGGVVYRYDEVVDTLVRLDNSYLFMSRFGEAKVSRKDTIYTFGGYGEFNYSDKLISFKQNYREWNVEPIEDPLPIPSRKHFIQYDTLSDNIYIGFGDQSFFNDGVERIRQIPFIYRFEGNHKATAVGSFESLIETTKKFTRGLYTYKQFHHYRQPLLYSKEGIWSIDLIGTKAIHHINPDLGRLQHYTQIIAYNDYTGRFLLAANYETKSPRYHVVNELDLLGLEYEEYPLGNTSIPKWVYLSVGLAILVILPLFRTKSYVALNDTIKNNERRIQQRLSSEDFNILQLITQAYPGSVEYPELQNSYQKDLSYESRIKKLRASIKEIDEVVQNTIGRKRNSIFKIEKGREDKRVKVIRIKNDELNTVDFFGRLKRKSK